MTGPGGREEDLRNFRTSNMRPSGLLGPDGEPIPVRIESAAPQAFLGFGGKNNKIDPSQGFTAVLKDQQAISATVRQISDDLRVAADMARQFQVYSQQALANNRAQAKDEARDQNRLIERMVDAVESAVTNAKTRSGLSTSSPNTPPGPSTPAPQSSPHPSRPSTGSNASEGSGGHDGSSPDSFSGSKSTPIDRAPENNEARELITRRIENAKKKSETSTSSPNTPPGPSTPAPQSSPAPPRPRAPRHARQPSASAGGTGSPDPPGGGGEGRGPNPPSGPPGEGEGEGGKSFPWTRGQLIQAAYRGSKHYAGGNLGGVARTIGMLGKAGKAIPVVGAAIQGAEIVNNALEGTTEQTRQNAAYQSIYAGSNWEGLGQRVQEQGFVWGNRLNAFGGGLNEEDARAAFQGVSELGLKDSQRSNALKLVEKNYADLGVNVQTSLKLLEMSAKGANMQFAGLEKSLKSVGTMARATGQNANVLYESFANNYQMALSMGTGPQAGAVAAGLTAATSGMSRDLQGVDTSGQSSYFYKRRLSQVSGMTYGQLEVQAARGNTEPLTQAQDKDRSSVAARALQGQGRGAMGLLQQRMQQLGGGQKLADSPAELSRVAQDMLMTGIDAQSMKFYMESYGGYKFDPGMSDQQITEAFAGWVADPSRGTRGAEATKSQMDQQPLDLMRESGTKIGYGFMGLGFNEGASEYVRKNYSLNPLSGEGRTKNSVLDAYSEHQYSTSKSDPVIEKFIDQVGNRSEVGVEVDTAKGKQVVSQADAIKYYSDQLARGTARFSGGDPDLDGKAVKDVIGAERNVDPGTDSTKDDAERGVTAEQWKKDHPTSASEAKDELGKVTISLQPGLEKIFNLQTEGAAVTDAGAAAGVPPTPTRVVPG